MLKEADDPDKALDDKEVILPSNERRAEAIKCTFVEALSHETKPPARFTEASV